MFGFPAGLGNKLNKKPMKGLYNLVSTFSFDLLSKCLFGFPNVPFFGMKLNYVVYD